MQLEQLGDTPELLGVEIRRYKNLRNVWLPWADGLALFGVNGAGKTNLLECLALLLGTAQTIALAAPRLGQPAPEDLAVVVRTATGSLPWPPDTVQPWAHLEPSAEASSFPFLGRAASDARWWSLLGASSGSDFSAGVASSTLPPPIAMFVSDLALRPVMRYGLTEIQHSHGLERGADPHVNRRFTRVLMAAHVPDEVADAAEVLPDAFAPLRTFLASGATPHSGWIPVLELPPTPEAPAALQWLPRPRTGEEVNNDLLSAFAAASGPAKELAAVLAELPLAMPPQDGDWHWWLHELGQKWGMAELSLTLPEVSIVALGEDDADFALFAGSPPRKTVQLSRTWDDNVLEYFSAGQRRWVDEALATVARELSRFGRQSALHADRYWDLPDDAVMSAVLQVAGDVDEAVRFEQFWSGETFDRVLQALEPQLLAAEMAYDSGEEHPVMREMQRHLNPGLWLLQPQLVIRAFDEPEAHLHPMAQRRTAAALNRLRLRGENIIIASHSPHFLDLPDWSVVHIQPAEDGTLVEPVAEGAAVARSALAKQLGVNRGELLAGINGLLLVEGKHDQVVLNRLFGTELRSAGLAVVRMYGTNNLMATAELDFLDRYLDVPITVLLDYTRTDRVAAGNPVTDEEKKLLELRRTCKRRGRPYTLMGLDRPDVVCYLSDTALQEIYPDFPGWRTVLTNFEHRRNRPPFKSWLHERFKVDLSHTGRIREVLDKMESGGHMPVGELTRKVNEILSHHSATEPHTV